VAWCENCNQFRDGEALSDDGECPHCGKVLVAPRRAPWHFKLIALATGQLYIAFRLVQLSVWIATSSETCLGPVVAPTENRRRIRRASSAPELLRQFDPRDRGPVSYHRGPSRLRCTIAV